MRPFDFKTIFIIQVTLDLKMVLILKGLVGKNIDFSSFANENTNKNKDYYTLHLFTRNPKNVHPILPVLKN